MFEVTKKSEKMITPQAIFSGDGDVVYCTEKIGKEDHIYPVTLADASCHGFPWSVNRWRLAQGEYCSIIPVCLITRIVSPTE